MGSVSCFCENRDCLQLPLGLPYPDILVSHLRARLMGLSPSAGFRGDRCVGDCFLVPLRLEGPVQTAPPTSPSLCVVVCGSGI